MKRAYHAVSGIFIIILVFACLLLVGAMLLGIRPYVVVSGSMEPKIPVGSVCFVNTNVPYGEIREEDVISFTIGKDRTVTHRVVSVTEEGMETKGDANEVSDGITTTEKNYVGKTILAIPYVGYAVMFLHSAKGKIFMIFLILFAVIWENAVIGRAGKRRQRKECTDG